MDYERLEAIADRVRQGNSDGVGVLSTGERLYVALAANNVELLGRDSIAYAIDRVGPEAVEELICRHKNEDVDHGVNRRQMDDLAALVRQLVRSLRNVQPDSEPAMRALDYLRRQGLEGSPLRGND